MSQEPRTEQSVKTLVDQARMASSDTGPLLSKLADTVEELSNKCTVQEQAIDYQRGRIAVLGSRIDELKKELASLRG